MDDLLFFPAMVSADALFSNFVLWSKKVCFAQKSGLRCSFFDFSHKTGALYKHRDLCCTTFDNIEMQSNEMHQTGRIQQVMKKDTL